MGLEISQVENTASIWESLTGKRPAALWILVIALMLSGFRKTEIHKLPKSNFEK